ncbi:MAG: hypothetical protein JO019_02380 [Candidatus Kaiserbacteria bacterium]|nr:hypothetical protein [Candidatus Kaiserbacteria bacterium]
MPSNASVVALLQTALMLLALAQSSPNASPDLRANAIQVAQQAISVATAALGQSNPAQTNPSFNTNTAATSTIVINGSALTTTVDGTSRNGPWIIVGINPVPTIANQDFYLTWKASNSTYCTMNKNGTSESIPLLGSRTYQLSDTTKFEFICSDGVTTMIPKSVTIYPQAPSAPVQPSGAASVSVTKIDGQQIWISYANLPAHAYITTLWKNENGQWEGGSQAQVPGGGTGTTVIQEDQNAPSGQYIARAQTTNDMYWRVDSDPFVYGGITTALNCTITASPSTIVSGQTVSLRWSSLGASHASWKQDASANLLGLPYGNIAADGYQTFTVSGKSGTLYPVLIVSRDDGLSGTCNTAINVTAPASQPSGTFDVTNMQYFMSSPLITGSASNVSSITVAVKGGNSASSNVVNGRWQAYVSQLYPGTYPVELLDNDYGPNYNKVLASATITIGVQQASTNPNGLPQCPANAASQRGQSGTFDCFCPPGFSIKTIWGGPWYYADLSDICTAGMQSGQMNNTYGGEVDYQLAPGQSVYGAWTSNGITSVSNGAWPGSFQIVGPKG